MKKKSISIILIVLIVVSTNTINSEAASGAWKISHGQWWYEYSDGSYAHNEYVDGYWLDGAGWYDSAWNGSWKTNSSGWWFQSGSWYPTAQWLKIDGEWYYFKSSGYMASNEWIGEYYVGSDGAWVKNKKKTSTTEQSTTETTAEKDHGARVEGNDYYGYYTEDRNHPYYVAPDGTEFSSVDALSDYCWEKQFAGYNDTPHYRLVWVWKDKF